MPRLGWRDAIEPYPMSDDISELPVGAYLKVIDGCDVVAYISARPGAACRGGASSM